MLRRIETPENRNAAPDSSQRIVTKARTPFRIARMIILAISILLVSGVGVIFLAYNFGKADKQENSEDEITIPSSDIVDSGKNVDYIQTSGGRPVFRVRAAKTIQSKDENLLLEDVIFDFYREQGSAYRITCKKARLNQKSGEAFLEGDVRVSGIEDLELTSRSLSILNNGQILESPGVVEFTNRRLKFTGRASHLSINRISEEVAMSSGVHIRSLADSLAYFRLSCLSLVYNRTENLIRASTKVSLTYDNAEIDTDFLSLYISEQGDSVSLIRARYAVKGIIWEQDRTAKGQFSAEFMELDLDQNDYSSIKLRIDGGNDLEARIEQIHDDGLALSITGHHLEAYFKNSSLMDVQADGLPVRVDEYLDFPSPFYIRRACARQLRAYKGSDGSLSRLTLDGVVDLQEVGSQLSGGDKAQIDGAQGSIEITGDPVEVNSDFWEFAAPAIRYSRLNGILHATLGVRASISSESGPFGHPLSEGGSDLANTRMRLEAEEATFTNQPRTFVFKGNVRAWQNDSVLLANQVRGTVELNELSASGDVKTVWQPSTEPHIERDPFVVTSNTLVYQKLESTLVFEGNSRLEQKGRVLKCDDLTFELTKSTPVQAERISCEGNVFLDDTISGQKASGDSAIYKIDSSLIELTGKEVHLFDNLKNDLTGRRLIYNLKDGRASLRSDLPRM